MTPKTTLTARSPEDLLAAARVVLGFEPSDSIVMLTFGARDACHARVDLPAVEHLGEVIEVLVRPAVAHGADAAVFVVYSDDHALARRAAHRLRYRFERAGVTCLEALRVDDGRWHPLLRRIEGLGGAGVPYDVTTHPFVAAAVLDGRVLHGSRSDLAATLTPVPEAVTAIERVAPQAPGSGRWVGEQVARHVAEATSPTDTEAARLLAAIADPSVRDHAWAVIRRSEARRHVELWSSLVRRCPRPLLAHAAAVLGISAWLAGDGALAWCAVDRACEVDPHHSLARLVSDLLDGAVAPSLWEQLAPGFAADLAARDASALGSAS